MKVLYDISVLGMAHYHERARTGIYRVVENVARGVAQSKKVELLLCSSLGNNRECLEFLATNSIRAPYSAAYLSNLGRIVTSDSGWATTIRHMFGRRSLKPVYHSPFYPIPDDVLKEGRIRKVQTVHDLIPILFPEWFFYNDDQLIKNVLSRVGAETQVICMSESTRNDLCNYSKDILPEQMSVVYSAASENFYPCTDCELRMAIRNKYSIPQHGRYLLSVSTLEPRKNIVQAIRSFARLVVQENITDLYLVLSGAQGWHYDNVFSEIKNSTAVRERIILTGFVPDEELAPLYSCALAFVYPSLYEGFGLPPLEAMQCGTPVITSNTSSLPEVVGDAGIMVDPNDGDALCQAMLVMYRDETLRNELSARSLARAKKFSWQKSVNETIAVYKLAAGG